MTWSSFYLFCFLVGFLLSLFSFLAGAVHIHLPFKMHLPHQGGHHGGGGGGQASSTGSEQLSWFNASSVTAFLAWFGGTGYVLSRNAHVTVLLGLSIASVAGLVGAWLIFLFLLKLLHSGNSEIRDLDYRMEGAVGTVTMPIHANGIGEIAYLLGGVRRSSGARSDDGTPIEKGAEIAVVRYEKGIAYVRRWEEFTK
jgi:membrane protein implicated in regulation of membrane protease activity